MDLLMWWKTHERKTDKISVAAKKKQIYLVTPVKKEAQAQLHYMQTKVTAIYPRAIDPISDSAVSDTAPV